VVICVKCASDKQGVVRTWVDSVPCATVRHEEIIKDGRFSIDPEQLFLFSSSKASMMPGGVSLRFVRVENGIKSNEDVRLHRARDKVISMFVEDRQKEIDEQRKGLSLATLFPKPRPIWSAPALTGTFGDAFLEGTVYEGSSLIGWSYTVLNHVLRQAVTTKDSVYLETLSNEARGAVSDVCHVMNQSGVMMKQMLKLLRHRNKSQLMSFLKKLRNLLEGLNTGESLVLPALVENIEMVIIVIRSTDQRFRFVIVQTDPQWGLQHHPVSPAEGPPKFKYRTCMVLSNIPKKNALDNVFWLALYNLSVHVHEGDMDKFYDVIVPFLTGKPLEASLVEAELTEAKENSDPGAIGAWRSPQRSRTAHVSICVCLWVEFGLV
jgi:hypothetical protein